MDTSYVLFAVLLFLAVVLSLEGIYLLWASKNSAEAKRIAARLRQLRGHAEAAGAVSIERARKRTHWSWLDDHVIEWLPQGDRLMRYLETSGTGTTAGELLVSCAAFAILGFLVPLMMGHTLLFSIAGALAAGVLPWVRISGAATSASASSRSRSPRRSIS
jgi:tight adherence protein B